ncbi:MULTISPECIES: RICIN domain-containing protein [Pseudoalteromonas]|uniref:Ricin-type beta-trefoil lectin domain protein n=1 Tax=Pseudoalteromonas luteoviolacea (strain 2ta16) TaxID=1353533 RepID=V4GZR1_PSEL2|nr:MULTISPECIES: RICIN domain-containing protein [Pseudoalteromonas]ESP90681.1 Ricin-type beta-trefoil lectin domain protein [Pseudoalteromonas luteoviolacea 2ta16]KZN41744.1 hypothetical protein N483_13825 [Pseudoalteromonas luteoviolacea NCIMB 1944]MCG7548097.1 RICIN domain-containing protein [Pseudoalteromonas sp. Of7M-16]
MSLKHLSTSIVAVVLTGGMAVSFDVSSQEIQIQNAFDTNYCLHKAGSDSASNGDNVHLWKCDRNNSNSKWYWRQVRYGLGQIELGNTGYCLSKKGRDSASNGDNIHLWDCNSGSISNSFWVPNYEKIHLYNYGNYCLQKQGTYYPRNGDNIHVWNCQSGHYANKEWIIHWY